MNSLRHVFWRGAMALSLLTLGVGSGFGFREVPAQAGIPACDAPALRASRPGGVERIDIDAARAVALQLRARAQDAARRG